MLAVDHAADLHCVHFRSASEFSLRQSFVRHESFAVASDRLQDLSIIHECIVT